MDCRSSGGSWVQSTPILQYLSKREIFSRIGGFSTRNCFFLLPFNKSVSPETRFLLWIFDQRMKAGSREIHGTDKHEVSQSSCLTVTWHLVWSD